MSQPCIFGSRFLANTRNQCFFIRRGFYSRPHRWWLRWAVPSLAMDHLDPTYFWWCRPDTSLVHSPRNALYLHIDEDCEGTERSGPGPQRLWTRRDESAQVKVRVQGADEHVVQTLPHVFHWAHSSLAILALRVLRRLDFHVYPVIPTCLSAVAVQSFADRSVLHPNRYRLRYCLVDISLRFQAPPESSVAGCLDGASQVRVENDSTFVSRTLPSHWSNNLWLDKQWTPTPLDRYHGRQRHYRDRQLCHLYGYDRLHDLRLWPLRGLCDGGQWMGSRFPCRCPDGACDPFLFEYRGRAR